MKRVILINSTWIIGLGMCGTGLWWINPAVSLIVVGGALFLISTAAAILPRAGVSRSRRT